MPFSSPLLTAHLKTGRIAHTYLFTGPEGEAKSEAVLAFAQALNCEGDGSEGDRFNRSKSVPARTVPCSCSGGTVPKCSSCRKIEKGTHPDVRWLGENEKARSIKIEEIRTLIHDASLKPFEGRWKVFVLKGAERLTLEAANALLKTLEEPPEHSVFLLLVENKAHLLETIQSRSFEIRTPPEPEKNPTAYPAIQLLAEKGRDAFFAKIREADRFELQQTLEALLLYLRDQSASEWDGRNPDRSEKFLKALNSVYETQEALSANVNQKLALTHLEIQLGNLLK